MRMMPLRVQTVSIKLLLGGLVVVCLWSSLETTTVVHAFHTARLPLKRPCLPSMRLSQTHAVSSRTVRYRYSNLTPLAASTTEKNAPSSGSRENETPPLTPTHTSTLPNNTETVWSKCRLLFQMTRPSSIPGVVLFHMVGTYLALSYMGNTSNYWTLLLKSPNMWLTFLCELLVSSTSMIVNDYYDAKLG